MLDFQYCTPQQGCVRVRAEGGAGEFILACVLGVAALYTLSEVLPALIAPNTQQKSVRSPLRVN